jgi:hypothetical protein
MGTFKVDEATKKNYKSKDPSRQKDILYVPCLYFREKKKSLPIEALLGELDYLHVKQSREKSVLYS